MAQVIERDGRALGADEVLKPIKDLIEQAKRDRARYEPTWHSNRAFAAGKQWLKWSRADRKLKLDPRDVEGGRERYTADVLTQYIQTAQGQLIGADDRPNLLFRRDDIPSEDFTEAANAALAYGWESEWEAERALASIRRKIIVDGTAAVQCRFDPTLGRERGEMPMRNGQPMLDPEEARSYVADLAETGETATIRRVNEGRICWDDLSAFNLLTPPGIEDEDDFPWEAIIDPIAIYKLEQLYGEKAKGLNAEPLAVLDMLGVKESFDMSLGGSEEESAQPGKLEGFVTRVRFYERPCPKYPKGRVVVYAGDRLLDMRNELSYVRANGDRSSGISYFRYWRVEGRFWGRGLVEAGKGMQRMFNRRCQQEHETIDRGQPYVIAEEGQEVKEDGRPLAVVRIPQGSRPAQPVQGIGPGEWMYRSKAGIIEDLERAMGIRGIALGDNPTNVNTYSQLALLREQDRTKIDPIVEDFQRSVGRLVEFSLHDMRRHWSKDKIIALAGEEDMAEAVEFKGSDLPEFYLLKIAEGAKPRSQAAEIQLIFDIFAKALEIQQPLTTTWLVESLEAGKSLPLPKAPGDSHMEKARWENAQIEQGNSPPIAYYDPIEVHLPEHREAQVEAELAGRDELVAALEQHIQDHVAQAQANAAQAAQDAVAAMESTAAASGGEAALGAAPQAPAPAPPAAPNPGEAPATRSN